MEARVLRRRVGPMQLRLRARRLRAHDQHGAEGGAVVEAHRRRARGDRSTGRARAGRPLRLTRRGHHGQRSDARRGVRFPRLVGQPRAALQREMPGRGIEPRPALPRRVERQRPEDRQLRHLHGRGARVREEAGGQRHLRHRRSRQYRRAAQRVVREPRLLAHVEGARPLAGLVAGQRHRAEAEQGVVARRVHVPHRLGAGRQAVRLAGRRRARQRAPLRRAVEHRRAARVGAQGGRAVGDVAERVPMSGPVLPPPQRGRHRRRRAGLAEIGAEVALQHRVRPDLQEQRGPQRGRRAHRQVEAHRLAQVPPPVERRHVGTLQRRAGDSREHRHASARQAGGASARQAEGASAQAAQPFEQRRAHRLHRRRVERVVNPG